MLSVSRWIAVAAAAIGLLGAACSEDGPAGHPAPAADPESGRVLFEMKCSSCHTLGRGDRAGPDLRGVTRRRTRDWLERWMKDPAGMSKNDADGKALFARYKNVPMPPSNLTEEQLADVLAHLERDGQAP